MDYLSWCLAVVVFAFIMTFTPGPNNIMLATSGVNFGLKRSLPHVFGVAVGFPVMLILVAGGIGFLFEVPIVSIVFKFLGVCYVAYLAWMICSLKSLEKEKVSTPITFWKAAGFQWVNPKAWAQAIGASSAYLTLDANKYLQVFAMAIIFLPIGVASSYAWAAFGGKMAQYLRVGGRLRYFNYTMGVLLIVTVIPAIASC